MHCLEWFHNLVQKNKIEVLNETLLTHEAWFHLFQNSMIFKDDTGVAVIAVDLRVTVLVIDLRFAGSNLGKSGRF